MAKATSKDPQAQAGLRRLVGMAAGVSVAALDILKAPITGAGWGRGAAPYLRAGAGFGAKPSSVQ